MMPSREQEKLLAALSKQIAGWADDPGWIEKQIALGDQLDGMLDDLGRIERRLQAILKILRHHADELATPKRL